VATAVKICGITRIDDALCAARLGAHAIGLVFYSPSARYVDPGAAAAIIRALPPFVMAVGLFVDAAPDFVRRTLAQAPVHLLQFHGAEPAEYCRSFGVPYIKAARMGGRVDLVQYARDYGDAKALLLDAFVDGLHGGTGATFDWALIPPSLPLPTVLSGGLDPANVGEAVRRVRPWAVDVSSGVEAAKGVKDPAKIAAFIAGVRNADV
jgi:phosphoribosylanthranilate isomerase